MLAMCVAVGALAGLDFAMRPSPPSPAKAKWPAHFGTGDSVNWQLADRGDIPMPPGMAAAHASSLLAMPTGHTAVLSAFWFSGDRESGPNVQIAASQYERASRQWTAARFVVNRFAMADQLGFGIRRLGNPVAWLDAKGRIHLFVVATGAGGWAASRILHLRQSSLGNGLADLTFEPLRVLPLSWLWNTSFLVRNAPLPLEDGGMILPVHFELGIKYPMAARFDAEGGFVGVVRLSGRQYWLQPSLVMQSPSAWLALMRDEHQPGKIGAAYTSDAGQHWRDLPELALDNPDSAVAGLGLAPGAMVLAHNSSIGTRATLDLSTSRNGDQWQTAHTIAQGGADDEYSYPALCWAGGSLWISYTVDRKRIAWQRFESRVSPMGTKP